MAEITSAKAMARTVRMHEFEKTGKDSGKT